MTETRPISLWDDTAAEADHENLLAGDSKTQVAIVGGGFTGLSTALHAARRGIECHVLEANRIGHGGSGRNVGLVNPGLWLPPQDVVARLGTERGELLLQTLGDAPAYVRSLIERYQIQCEATFEGTIHAAHSPRALAGLERRAEAWLQLGAPVTLLSRAQAADRIGSLAFHGGLFDARAGTINPMGYVRGLARVARSAGARISTGVRVRLLERQGQNWILETDHGRITADYVVLGTNAYTDDLWPGLSKTFIPIPFFQVATVPLGERVRSILRNGEGLWDTGMVMSAVRRDIFGRLIMGSMGRVFGGQRGLSIRWAGRNIRRFFPSLGQVEFENAWYGRIALTLDHLPRIYRLADNLYSPIGYNGRGITPGTVFGRAMAELLDGGREEELPLVVTKPEPVALAPLKSRLYSTAFAAGQLWRSL